MDKVYNLHLNLYQVLLEHQVLVLLETYIDMNIYLEIQLWKLFKKLQILKILVQEEIHLNNQVDKINMLVLKEF